MTPWTTALLLLLLPPASEPSPAPAGLQIRGTVTTPDGTPVAGAGVTARGVGREVGARTDGEGRFALAGLEAAEYRVRVTAPGFESREEPLPAGTEDALFVLQPASRVVGSVVDPSEQPVDSGSVELEAGERRVQGSVRRDGTFALDAPAGTYTVTVNVSGRGRAVVDTVVVASGATTDLGRVTLRPPVVLRGLVVDASGTGIPGATVAPYVTQRGRRSPAIPDVVTDGEGRFTLREPPPGRLRLHARHPEWAEGMVEVGVPEEGDPEAEEVKIVLARGARLEGVVLRRDGAPMTEAAVHVATAYRRPAAPEAVPVGPDGSYRFEHAPAGSATVFVMVPERGRLVSAMSREVVLRDGETQRVDFQSQDVVVRGSVKGAVPPFSGLRVRFAGRRSGTMSIASPGQGRDGGGLPRQQAPLRADGSFALVVGAPGPYTVHVDGGPGRAYPGRAVEIAAAEAVDLEIDVSGVVLRGRVVDARSGEPLSAAHVGAAPEGSPGGSLSVVAGGDGRFELTLDARTYRVWAQAPRYVRRETKVTVDAEPPEELVFSLSRGGTLTGTVHDRLGRPVAGARVAVRSAEPPAHSASASSRPDGGFEITGLPVGLFNLVVTTDRGEAALRPGVPGDTSDLRVDLGPAGRLRVRVVDPQGQPARAAILVQRIDGHPVTVSAPGQGPDGAAELELPAGTVEVLARGVGLPAAGWGQATVTVVAGLVTPLEIVLKPR